MACGPRHEALWYQDCSDRSAITNPSPISSPRGRPLKRRHRHHTATKAVGQLFGDATATPGRLTRGSGALPPVATGPETRLPVVSDAGWTSPDSCAGATSSSSPARAGSARRRRAAALASLAADAGLDVLVVALDDASGLAALFGYEGQLGYDEVVVRPPDGPDGSPAAARVAGRVRARVLTSDAALLEYLGTHGLGRFAGRLVRTGALDVVATAIPGIREVLILGKVRQLEEAGAADLIVLDAPATGHALRFLASSGGLADAARGGPLRAQADQVVAMLADPARCQVVLVTIPEETPVNEAVETAFRLEDEIGVALGPVVVNCCYPLLDAPRRGPRPGGGGGRVARRRRRASPIRSRRAAAFRRARQELQLAQRAQLADRLPLPTNSNSPTCSRPTSGPPSSARSWLGARRGDRGAAVSVLDDLVDERSVIVCCGSGGVGKTTAAAALAVAAALRGRRACVVTIDPARRLADALGVERGRQRAARDRRTVAGGAARRDARRHDDFRRARPALRPRPRPGLPHPCKPPLPQPRLGARRDPGVHGDREAVRAARRGHLRPHRRRHRRPTRHALEFLDAPRRLENFLGNRIFRVFVAPGSSYLRVASLAGQLVLRSIARVAGAEIVDDTLAFFGAFQGMEQGFRDRAAAGRAVARRALDRVRPRRHPPAGRDRRRPLLRRRARPAPRRGRRRSSSTGSTRVRAAARARAGRRRHRPARASASSVGNLADLEAISAPRGRFPRRPRAGGRPGTRRAGPVPRRRRPRRRDGLLPRRSPPHRLSATLGE